MVQPSLDKALHIQARACQEISGNVASDEGLTWMGDSTWYSTCQLSSRTVRCSLRRLHLMSSRMASRLTLFSAAQL